MARNQNKPKDKNNRGLYGGKAGDYAAQAYPQQYYNALLAQGGYTPESVTNPHYWDWLQNQGFSNFYTGYQNAQADNERLKLKNYANTVYGQEIGRDGLFPAGFQAPQSPAPRPTQPALGGAPNQRANQRFIGFLGRNRGM